jgi:hypothetical protein
MAPTSPKSAAPTAPAENGTSTAKVGPHPGFITSSNQYSSEIKIRRMLRDNGCDPAREDNYRLQGVQLIDNVRGYLQLYVFIPPAFRAREFCRAFGHHNSRRWEEAELPMLTVVLGQTGPDV